MSGPTISRQQSKKLGFTIVELLIVIVVIAILATVTIVAYNGVRQRSSEATVKSELSQIAKQLGILNVNSSQYPANINSIQKNTDFIYQYTYTEATNDYCLTASSNWAEFYISSENTTPQNGFCAGHTSQMANVGQPVLPVWSDISASSTHSCGVLDGKAYCWGQNTNGQLGDGTVIASLNPVAVSTSVMSGTVTDIETAFAHTCAIADGVAYCWGNNGYGRLGDNTNVNKPEPVAVHTNLMSETVTSIAVGGTHSCAVAGGTAYCWGRNIVGQLGNSSVSQSYTPIAVTTSIMSGTVTDIVAGYQHSCALASANAYCWGGYSGYGQLGNGSTGTSTIPVATSTGLMAAGTVTSIGASSDSYHTCAISAQKAYCWGHNGGGKVGDGTSTNRASPTAVNTSLMSGDIASVSGGGTQSCAVYTTGQVFCWGANSTGQLGDGTTSAQTTPKATDMSGINGLITKVTTGGSHTCAISANNAYCWGQNTNGQLGDGTTTNSLSSVEVLMTP